MSNNEMTRMTAVINSIRNAANQNKARSLFNSAVKASNHASKEKHVHELFDVLGKHDLLYEKGLNLGKGHNTPMGGRRSRRTQRKKRAQRKTRR